MHHFITGALRAVIAVVVPVGLFGQVVVIPVTAADEVDRFPAYGPLAAPYAVLAILGVACVQVALVATWRLLGMAQEGVIFAPKAFRWVDVIIGSAMAATALAMGAAVHLALAEIPSPDEGMDVESALAAAITAAGVGASFTMLTVIMRSLLGKATALQTEMAEVI
ncbi:hypothetical protein GCM10010277_06120 [Streptomyces longisporoflavus]|uniref:DUF2975 domain-containing protein n=1 Tax=Streptomyces longisporoflavus TaxID=28044 RepID=UPI00167CC8C9|nr:DUF2975 domain-containing protein [Streptomyces longisporoflavus]GGV25252.1 hypothetical protein GCM10010277_06120 [Streptomyces longisporoflavus]